MVAQSPTLARGMVMDGKGRIKLVEKYASRPYRELIEKYLKSYTSDGLKGEYAFHMEKLGSLQIPFAETYSDFLDVILNNPVWQGSTMDFLRSFRTMLYEKHPIMHELTATSENVADGAVAIMFDIITLDLADHIINYEKVQNQLGFKKGFFGWKMLT